MYCSNLLQGVAEATHQLLTNSDFAVGVNQSLATLGRVTGADQVYIFEIHPDSETCELTFSQRFEWTKEFVTPQIHNPYLQNQALTAYRISRWYDDLQAGKAIRGLIGELPNGEPEVLAPKQIRSILVVPIPCNGKLWGLIGFDDRHYDRQWSKDEEACLITMAASVGKAIAHQQTTETLRQSELRLQQITANVPGMIFPFLQRSEGSQALPDACSDCRGLFKLELEAILAACGGELIDSDDRKENNITERKQAEMTQRLVQERDRLLAEMALRIRKSLDLDEIFNTTVAEVRSFLKADRVFIASDVTEKGRVVAESVEPNYAPIIDWVLDDQSSLEEMRTLFEANQVRVVEDTTQVTVHPAIASYYRDYHVKAVVAVPIRVEGDRLLGALIVHQCRGARRWEPMEIALLEQLGTQVAIAIQQSCLFQQVQELNANLECQVRERTAQLEQKMQEVQELYELKDVFLHAVSHDLRTPLTGWLLVLQNLLANSNEQRTIPVSRSILERMIQSSDRQLRLINSLLEVHTSEVRGFALHREPVQLHSLIQEIVEDFEPLCVKNQAILINQIPSELSTVNADPLQMRRVFENLLTNAFNHNPPGLTMILRATIEEQVIRCTIEDNGVGMNPEQCDRAFELYVRGSQARRSTGIGLGLYLCRQIVQAHGGKIGVTSSPGAGATFWFTLPFAMSPEAEGSD
nr:GAF domain-containing protein [Coleofasciculus sp. FACHB-1120]